MPEPRIPPSPVVITGATGFIGQRIQAHLLREGHTVRALLRTGSRHAHRLAPSVESITVSLTGDPALLERALSDAKAVIYGAGTVRGRSFADFEPANVGGVKNLAEILTRMRQPPPLLLISSLAAARPEVSYYARSKFEGEKALGKCPSVPWAIIRPPAVYGPGDKEMRPLFAWARRGVLPVVGPRQQRLSLLHVDDLARAAAAWLENWQACRARTFAIDDGRPGGYDWTAIGQALRPGGARLLKVPSGVLQLIGWANQFLSGVLGYAPMLTPGKVRELSQDQWLGDNSAFSAATGWQPDIELASGVRALFAKQ